MGALLNLKKGVADSTDVLNIFEVASANGAISIPDRGSKTVFVTKAGVCAMTLTAPTATTHDGVRITFVSTTAQAHTLTVATAGMNDLGASGDVGTFGGAKGDGLTLVAYQGDWFITGNINVTLA
jgi:hypothetical protein